MIERLLSTRIGKFFQIFFSVYVIIWGLAEPLNLKWITDHPTGWRIALVGLALLGAIIRLIDVTGRSLETIDASTLGKSLKDYATYGNPETKIVTNGHVGKVMTIKGNYEKDELDWSISPNAQKAGRLVFFFSQKKLFYFYLRIVVRSKSGGASLPKWIRFDNTLADVQGSPADDEMGCPYNEDVITQDGLSKVQIDIKKYVEKTYGQAGWQYQRLMVFRIRTYDGIVKSISFGK